MHTSDLIRRRIGLARCGLLVAPLLLLAGCGQKGPLTLPNPGQESTTPAANTAEAPVTPSSTPSTGGQP